MLKEFIKRIVTRWYGRGLKKIGKKCSIITPVFFRGKDKIKIGNYVVIGRCGRIETYSSDLYKNPDGIIIDDYVNINWYCHIGAINKIHIKQNVLIGSYVLITDHSHGDNLALDNNPLTRELFSPGPVIIEENCWIGEKVTILPNVTIGHNSIIGANSVVTKDIPPFSIAVGCPAKVIKQR